MERPRIGSRWNAKKEGRLMSAISHLDVQAAVIQGYDLRRDMVYLVGQCLSSDQSATKMLLPAMLTRVNLSPRQSTFGEHTRTARALRR